MAVLVGWPEKLSKSESVYFGRPSKMLVGVSNRTLANRLGEFRALVDRVFPELRRLAS